MDERLSDIELFLLDMDGTLYISNTLIDGAIETLNRIESEGKRYCFLTNNSSHSYQEYLTKLKSFGLDGEGKLHTSVMSAADLIEAKFKGKKVYALATDGVKNDLERAGIKLVAESPDIVLICYDTGLDYQRLTKACKYIAEGAVYIVTHSDKVCPSSDGNLPDVGSFISLIATVTGRMPDYDCGKPSDIMASSILKRFAMPAHKVAMVGDRLYTDIRFANNNDFKSVLVLSGETDILAYEKGEDMADVVLKSIKYL